VKWYWKFVSRCSGSGVSVSWLYGFFSLFDLPPQPANPAAPAAASLPKNPLLEVPSFESGICYRIVVTCI
jgi:hypothetical protein